MGVHTVRRGKDGYIMIYQYRCNKGHEFDRVLPVSQYKEPQTCECGAESIKILVPVRGYVDNFEAFKDSTGDIITSRRAWNNHLRKNDAVEMGISDLKSQHQSRVKKVQSIGKDPHRKERIIAEFNNRRI